MNIFTVTGVAYSFPKKGSRCFGWYPSYKKAEKAVLENKGSLDEEGYYKHIVIEEIPKGVWNSPDSEVWFEWKDKSYVKIPKPKKYKSVVCFGMG